MKYVIIFISLVISIITSISFYVEGKDKIEKLSERIAAIMTCLLGGCVIFVICIVAFSLMYVMAKTIIGAM